MAAGPGPSRGRPRRVDRVPAPAPALRGIAMASRIAVNGPVASLALDATGARVAVGSSGAVRVFDARSGTQLDEHPLPFGGTAPYHMEPDDAPRFAARLQYAPDGRRLFAQVEIEAETPQQEPLRWLAVFEPRRAKARRVVPHFADAGAIAALYDRSPLAEPN